MEKIDLSHNKYIKNAVYYPEQHLIDARDKHIIEIAKCDGFYIVSYVDDIDYDAFANIQNEPREDKLLKEALNTELNTDPFGGVHSGETLREIYNNDPQWLNRAIKELKNKFIKDKINIILKAVEDGKIIA